MNGEVTHNIEQLNTDCACVTLDAVALRQAAEGVINDPTFFRELARRARICSRRSRCSCLKLTLKKCRRSYAPYKNRLPVFPLTSGPSWIMRPRSPASGLAPSGSSWAIISIWEPNRPKTCRD